MGSGCLVIVLLRVMHGPCCNYTLFCCVILGVSIFHTLDSGVILSYTF